MGSASCRVSRGHECFALLVATMTSIPRRYNCQYKAVTYMFANVNCIVLIKSINQSNIMLDTVHQPWEKKNAHRKYCSTCCMYSKVSTTTVEPNCVTVQQKSIGYHAMQRKTFANNMYIAAAWRYSAPTPRQLHPSMSRRDEARRENNTKQELSLHASRRFTLR